VFSPFSETDSYADMGYAAEEQKGMGSYSRAGKMLQL